ncbi:RNA polymerase sigma factor SigX [Bacillus lacus]|uniref:RNA polymerase sigma factor n=1 Tax=Metabacillus lacus TaxID=1983721 RepID=A0A7X2IWE4_9BACI|nr:RNA polymerase sigma factor SigX [Metabacillus lacus]MRX71042.1 RNA polymerase sigma factor SigX [Metabacillus lacus]
MEKTFHRLYETYHYDIFQYLYYMVKNREQAEDLTQEVYIRVLRAYDKFEGRSSEKTWILSIARHVAIDWFRKQKTVKQRILEKFDWEKEQIRDAGPLPDEITMQGEQVAAIYKALDSCTVDQKSVVILRYIQGLSISESAEALSWTESKVKTTQHRALKAIKKCIEEFNTEEGYSHEEIQSKR